MLQEFNWGGGFFYCVTLYILLSSILLLSTEKGRESLLINILLHTRTSIMEIGCFGTSKLFKQTGLVTIQLCGAFLWGCFGGRLLT